jgi:small acid-soluble spore protein D (minor alpha/beta-type SASP)
MATEAKKTQTAKAAPKAAAKTSTKASGKTARKSAIPPAMSANAKEAMHRIKMQAASEVGVSLKQGYNGDLTARQAGKIGGQMVKKMIQAYGK